MILRSTDVRAALRRRQQGFLLNPFRFGAPPSPAFTWDNVVIAMSGENNLDESPYEWHFDSATLSVDNAQAKFGTYSLYNGGTSNTNTRSYPIYLADFRSDATLDFWVRPQNSNIMYLLGQRSEATGYGWAVFLNSTGTFYITATSTYVESSVCIVTNVWQHIRIVRSGGTMYLFHNGVLVGSGALTIDAIDAGSSHGFRIGVRADTLYPLTGHIDEIIYSREALTTAGFAVPTAAMTRGSFSGYSAWNPSDKGAAVTLSAGNRLARTSSSSQSARGTQGYSTGKHYFEVTSTGGATDPDHIVLVGVGQTGASLTLYPGFDAWGWAFYPQGAQKYTSNTPGAYGSDTDTVGVMWNATDGEVSFKVSASAPSVAFTGVTGFLHPMWGAGSSGGARTGSINTGATAFRWGLPSGFSAWH